MTNMLPGQQYDSILDRRIRRNSSLSEQAFTPNNKLITSATRLSPAPPQPTTALFLVNGNLVGFQVPSNNLSKNEDSCNSKSNATTVGERAPFNSFATSLDNREEAGVDDGLFEPLPLNDDISGYDCSSVRSKKQSVHDPYDKLMNLTTYTTSLDDPFSPLPLLEAEDDDGLSSVDETSIEIEKFYQSMSSFGSDTEGDDDVDYDGDQYLEIAEILQSEREDDQASHRSKRPRTLPQHELNDFAEIHLTASRLDCRLTLPSSPEHSSVNSETRHHLPKTTNQPTTCSTDSEYPSASSTTGPSSISVVQTDTMNDKQRMSDCTGTPEPMDAASIMARLDHLMFKSELTQAALQLFDKRRGLPKSHCQTMVNSSRSRKQLLEGKIIKKWNGRPLLGGVEGRASDAVSVASEAGPRCPHRRRRRRRRNQTIPKETYSWEPPHNNLLTEEVLSEDAASSIENQNKPKRRMSAPC